MVLSLHTGSKFPPSSQIDITRQVCPDHPNVDVSVRDDVSFRSPRGAPPGLEVLAEQRGLVLLDCGGKHGPHRLFTELSRAC